MQRLLRAVREHLDLDVAFVGEVVDDRRVFRHVDAEPGTHVVAVGQSDPLEETYCHLVLTGNLPAFVRDASQHPIASRLPVTESLPVGTHISVPIRFSDGRVYGTFCCFTTDVRERLDEGDVRAVRMTAELAGEYLETIDRVQQTRFHQREAVEQVLRDPAGMSMVFQPLRDLATMRVVALEALARIPTFEHGPAGFFSQAEQAGLGLQAEMRAVRLALDHLGDIPAPIRLAASARLTSLGIWLAIDDVGMGFSGLNRILETSPEELKLDAAFAHEVDRSPAKQAMVAAFCSFGARMSFNVVAEGIETEQSLTALRVLGVRFGQGYHLGRPMRIDELDLS